MGTYSYTSISSIVPPIPILPITLFPPETESPITVNCQAILDTGSDCTLIPIPLLIQARAKIVDTSTRIPVGGIVAVAIPFLVGLTFDRYIYSTRRVFGCSLDDIGEISIIGRDIMNLHTIEFNGLESHFTIS